MTEPLFTVVTQVVARYYSVTPEIILSRSRVKSATVARAAAMYVARLAGDFSYPEIGQAFGRDNTTVMSAIKKVARRAATNPLFQAELEKMQREVSGLGIEGDRVTIRHEILTLIQGQVKQGIYGATVEDIVDRILCAHFQRAERESGTR